MSELIHANMFLSCSEGDALCVTTNGVIKKDGALVMGAGVAKTFRDGLPGIDVKLGKLVSEHGNNVHYLGTASINGKSVHIFSFPTKNDWKDKSDLSLIRQSCVQLKALVEDIGVTGHVFLPKPGCSNGGLDWDTQVKPIVEKHLDSPQYQVCDFNDFSFRLQPGTCCLEVTKDKEGIER